MPKISDDEHEKEYALMLLLFKKYLKSRSIAERWGNLEAIMTQRARNLVRHAVNGLGISYEKALELISASSDDLTEYERNLRTSLLAAFDNLADFAVVEEYQMADELPEWDDEFADEEEELDDDEIEGFIKVFKKYNKRYARVENLDVMYAMMIAARFAKFHEGTTLIYMTQGDNRVRPWHLDWEGFEAPKERFPEWLIPPIEAGCRCFLVEDSVHGDEIYDKVHTDVMASVAQPQMPFWFNRTFKESVAKGGRIFSDEHPYFQVDAKNVDRLREISERIKQKLMSNAEDQT